MFPGLMHIEAVTVAVALFHLVTVSGKVMTCSWSNEGCSENKDCCSKSCYRAFEGVNPRCRHSTIGEQCIFSYHCGYDLDCGPHFNCCAPYWKMCTQDSDCCDPKHVCIPADGFYYDRCLYPSAASILPPLTLTLCITTMMSVLGFLKAALL